MGVHNYYIKIIYSHQIHMYYINVKYFNKSNNNYTKHKYYSEQLYKIIKSSFFTIFKTIINILDITKIKLLYEYI